MKEIRKVSDTLEQFVFSQDNNLEVNITAIYNKDEVLLIDAGYTPQARAVKEYLNKKGKNVVSIVLIHYHPDHAAGTNVFEGVKFSCSHHYEESYKNCNEIWHPSHTYRKPDATLKNQDRIHFGKTTLVFYEAPGHSKCSLNILINDEILHVGDLIMTDAFEKPTLPFISPGGSFEEHIETLEKIKTMGVNTLLLSHGQPITGNQSINEAINKRLFYLKAVLKTNGEKRLEEFIQGKKEDWSFTKWHHSNIKSL